MADETEILNSIEECFNKIITIIEDLNKKENPKFKSKILKLQSRVYSLNETMMRDVKTIFLDGKNRIGFRFHLI